MLLEGGGPMFSQLFWVGIARSPMPCPRRGGGVVWRHARPEKFFSWSIPPKLENKLHRHKQRFGKIVRGWGCTPGNSWWVCHPVLQTPPYFRPKYVTLWGGTYLYGLYKGVPSCPLPGRATLSLLLHVALFLEMKCGILYQEPITYIEYFLLETAAYI